jgi:hypothetical protein
MIKHGQDDNNKCNTHVVSLQADCCQHINYACKALVHDFKLSANSLPKEIFFVPSLTNGIIKANLYYDLVNLPHENMASNLWSFAITRIDNVQMPLTAHQDSTDITSSIPGLISLISHQLN